MDFEEWNTVFSVTLQEVRVARNGRVTARAEICQQFVEFVKHQQWKQSQENIGITTLGSRTQSHWAERDVARGGCGVVTCCRVARESFCAVGGRSCGNTR